MAIYGLMLLSMKRAWLLCRYNLKNTIRDEKVGLPALPVPVNNSAVHDSTIQ